MSSVAAYVNDQQDRYLEQLKQVLRIPSISTDPNHAGEVRRASEWVENRLRSAGCTKVEIHTTARHPIDEELP